MPIKMAVTRFAIDSRAAPRATMGDGCQGRSQYTWCFSTPYPAWGPARPGAGYVSMGKPSLTVACSPRACGMMQVGSTQHAGGKYRHRHCALRASPGPSACEEGSPRCGPAQGQLLASGCAYGDGLCMRMRACEGHGARPHSPGRRSIALHVCALCGMLCACVPLGRALDRPWVCCSYRLPCVAPRPRLLPDPRGCCLRWHCAMSVCPVLPRPEAAGRQHVRDHVCRRVGI